MGATELKEIKDYWTHKYPHIYITLWENDRPQKYFGKMMAANSSIDLQANTIGELINQGENFLRHIK